jgi:hypothetical protein
VVAQSIVLPCSTNRDCSTSGVYSHEGLSYLLFARSIDLRLYMTSVCSCGKGTRHFGVLSRPTHSVRNFCTVVPVL